ncbi:PIG-L family deacetylase [Kribbella sp. NPDC026611]|uniref:PIG-L deacetylase family protein n=1 Tax=Kribbella sp. NPDC026611 TaxID=3154911 RepID=UPI0033FD7432
MRTALVVHAHPDDEVFATGAATSALSEQGWYVVLRVATAGVGSAADHLTASCELLGIDEWDWLGTEDQWIDDGGHAGPQTLAAAEPATIAEEIEMAVLAVEPQLLLTVGSDGLTGHPDHIAISQAVQLALERVHCRTLGARLRAQDVRAGEQLLQQFVAGQPGSGRMVGCGPETPLEDLTTTRDQRRRQAMDEYYPGLGTQPLEELTKTHNPSSDGLLLRAVYDATSWQTDRFEELSASDAPSSR